MTYQIERSKGLVGNSFLHLVNQVLPSGLGERLVCKENTKASGGEGTNGNGWDSGNVPTNG